MSLRDIEMKAASKTRTPKPARRKPAAEAVTVKGHAPAFREIIGLIQPARQRAFQAVNTELIGLYSRYIKPSLPNCRTTGATISIVSPAATQLREQHKFQVVYGSSKFLVGRRIRGSPKGWNMNSRGRSPRCGFQCSPTLKGSNHGIKPTGWDWVWPFQGRNDLRWSVRGLHPRLFRSVPSGDKVGCKSRALSPALIAEYQTRLPDRKLLQRKLHEFYQLAMPRTK